MPTKKRTRPEAPAAEPAPPHGALFNPVTLPGEPVKAPAAVALRKPGRGNKGGAKAGAQGGAARVKPPPRKPRPTRVATTASSPRRPGRK